MDEDFRQLSINMNDYIDIHESFNIAELQLIKNALSHHDIDYHILNETLLQLGNMEAMGYSGARVQVNSLQATAAKILLDELKLVPLSEAADEEMPFWMERFTKMTDQLPFLNWMAPFLRFLMVVLLSAILLFVLLFVFSD